MKKNYKLHLLTQW